MDQIFFLITRNRNSLVRLFKLLFIASAFLYLYVSYLLIVDSSSWGRLYSYGRTAGQAGIIFFVLTSIPGIFRRFKVNSKFLMIFMLFRRYLGISMYICVFFHASIIRLIPWITAKMQVLPLDLFIISGICALTLLTPLFLTSNDLSVKRLGIWWDKIHDLTYWIVWFIFVHVLLQGITFWSVIIGITAFAQVSSHVYAGYMKMKANNGIHAPA